MTPGVHLSRATDRPANSAPRRVRRRRGSLRPAITGGLAVIGATALVGTFVTPAPAEARTTAYAVSAPTPTPLLAALTLPIPQAQVDGVVDAAARLGLDLDADLLLSGDVVAMLADIGAALRLWFDLDVDLDIDVDVEAISAAFAALINDIALGIDGGAALVNGVVDLGAGLVSEIALAASAAGVEVVDAITGALLSTLAALAPEGGVGAELFASIGGAINGIGELFATGFLGAGEAVAWKATLDDVLVDLLATGTIALTNGLAGGLIAALGVDADLPDLPDIDGEDVVLALGALIEHFTDGINGALLTGGGAVELGVELIADLARAVAETGVDIRGAITGAFLGSLDVLAPDAPFADAVAELVGDISVGLDAGIRGLGEAVAWKFTLDDVLVDVAVAGGVSLVNGLTTGLFGGIGLPLPELPEVDFAASVRALINHFAVALGIELDLEGDVDVEVPPNEDEGDGQVELLSDGFDVQRSGLVDDGTDSGSLPADEELEPAEGGDDDLPPADEATGDAGDSGDPDPEGTEDLGDAEQLPEDDDTGEVSEDSGEESEDGDPEAEDAGDTGAETDGGADAEPGGDPGGDSPTE